MASQSRQEKRGDATADPQQKRVSSVFFTQPRNGFKAKWADGTKDPARHRATSKSRACWAQAWWLWLPRWHRLRWVEKRHRKERIGSSLRHHTLSQPRYRQKRSPGQGRDGNSCCIPRSEEWEALHPLDSCAKLCTTVSVTQVTEPHTWV